MKKLMIITLLSATAGSAWGAARLESASNLATLQRSLASFGKSQQQLGAELAGTKLDVAPDIKKAFLVALNSKDAGKELQEFFKKNNPDTFWGVSETLKILNNDKTVRAEIKFFGPLTYSALRTSDDPLRLLLEHNFPLTRNERNESAFHIAAARLDVKKLNMLLNKFVSDVNVHQENDPRDWKNSFNDTPYQVWLRAKERKKAAGAPFGIDDAIIKDIEEKLKPVA